MALGMAITDIKSAIDHRVFYAALVTTLSLPHICSSLENGNNRSNGSDYKNWYSRYVESRFSGTLSAEACYSLRCGMIHQGQVSVPGHPQVERVIFRLPQ